MNIKAIHNFVSECKDKLWISSEDEEVLEIKITKEMKGVLTLWVLTQIIDENG